jgi:molybdopterin/thiamine biosynthesis adenylyltransferase
MTAATLVLPEPIAQELENALRDPLETAGVIIASLVDPGDGTLRLLARELRWVDKGSYLRRECDVLSIRPEGYVPALGRAEQLHGVAIWTHTHPSLLASPNPSKADAVVDTLIADLFRWRTGSGWYASLIVSPTTNGFNFTGQLSTTDKNPILVTRVWIVGERFRLVQPPADDSRVAELFDRNVRAFGGAIQRTLGDLQIGIVGCGGTGSAVAEQLTRLGARHLLLIDPDLLSETNTTRVYGSTPADVGRPKVDVLATHLRRIAPTLACNTRRGSITEQATARCLTTCDIIFGCTDDNAGRLVLSRVATYLLTPVIDSGVLLSSDENQFLTGIDARTTTLTPGQACLLCRGRIDPARAGAELLTPSELHAREDEGYAPALGRTEPSVVTFTTLIAAAAVTELLERLVGFGPDPRPSEVLFRFHEREVSTNRADPRPSHFCNPAVGKLGIGISTPFLDIPWPS